VPYFLVINDLVASFASTIRRTPTQTRKKVFILISFSKDKVLYEYG
jgi:hypothetical protein